MKPLSFMGRWDLRAPDRAITVNTGNSVRAQFSGPTLNAVFDISLNQSPLPVLTWRIDNQPWQESEVAASVSMASHLPEGSHTVWLMIRGLDEHQNRWTDPLVSSITFLGFSLPDGGNILPPLEAWVHPKLKMEFLGDSITEGVLVCHPRPGKDSWAWQTDALDSHACQTAMRLGADWRQVGFGATGIEHGGSGGGPGAIEGLNFFHAGCPRDDWQPDLVVINQGTNDSGMDPKAYEPLYAKYLGMVRAAYPKARIAAVRPFVGAQETSIKKAVEAAQAAGDHQIYYIDTTGWYSGDLHPNAESSVGIADKLAATLKTQVLGSTAP